MTDGGSGRPNGTVRRPIWFATITVGFIAVAAPVLWAVLTREVRYTGDMALIELRVRDVISANPPISGAYSRYGWAHLGPWQFYGFAVPYRLLGADATALQLTTLGFNLGVAGTIVWLAARRDRATAIIVACGLLALIAGLRPLSLAHGWNVTVAVLPFVLVAVGCWRALSGDRWAVPITAASAIFVVGAHIGVGIVITPLVIATGAVIAGRWWRDRDESRTVPQWLTAAVLTTAAAPIVIEIAADPPGNLGRLVRWSLTNDEPQVGLDDSLLMIGRSSSLSFVRNPKLPGRFFLELGSVDPGLLPGFSILLLAFAWVGAHRRGWSEERMWCGIVAGLWVTGVIAGALITEPLGWWLVQWLQPLGWLTWTAIALVAWRFATEHVPPARRPAASRWVVAGCLAIAGLATIDHGRDALRTPDLAGEYVRPVDGLTDGVIATIDDRPARLDFAGSPLLAETMLSGVVNRLAGLGVDVCVDEQLAYKLGTHRVCGDDVERRFVVRVEPRTMAPPDGTGLVVAIDPLSTVERSEADRLADRIESVLVATGRSDLVPLLDGPLADVVLLDDPSPELSAIGDDVERLAELRNVPGDRYALYATT